MKHSRYGGVVLVVILIMALVHPGFGADQPGSEGRQFKQAPGEADDNGKEIDQTVKDVELVLVVGKPRPMKFRFPIGDLAVGAPQICSAVADRGQKRIILSPLSPGSTSILVFDTQGQQRINIKVTVTSQDLDAYLNELKKLFHDIEGVELRRVGQKIIVEGEVYLTSDLQRIYELTRASKDVVLLVNLSADTQKVLAKKIQREIALPGVAVSATKERIILKGEVYQKGDIEKASKIASIYVDPSRIVNVLGLKEMEKPPTRKKMVQITAYFVELNKRFLRNFNFYWGPIPTLSVDWFGTSTPTGEFKHSYNIFGAVTDILPKLNTAKALGVARMYENPTVTVKSEDEAVLQGGAEVSFPEQTKEGSIAYGKPQSIGVTLKVRPFVIGESDIDLKVSVSVRDLGEQTIPGAVTIKNSSIDTSQFVRSGESVAIGGLIANQVTESRDRPMTSPATSSGVTVMKDGTPTKLNTGGQAAFGNLFTLFKARDFQKERREFIVFITSKVLASASEGNAALKEFLNLEDIYPTTVVSEEDIK